jgi:hypothetical protein
LRGYAHEPVEGPLSQGLLPFVSGGFHATGQADGFTTRKLQIEFQHNEKGERLAIGRDWFDKSELVVVRATQEATLERTLTMARFHLEEGTETSAPIDEVD